MAKISVGGRVFPSKAAALDACREILYRYKHGQTVAEADADLLRGVVALHRKAPQKIGCGIASFQVEENMYGMSGFWLTRVDGSRTDFSFIKCFTHGTPKSDALKGMRRAIKAQTDAFRASHPPVCAITGQRLRADEIHVDHDPPFANLVAVFMSDNDLTFDDIPVNETEDGDQITYMANAEQRKAWEEFHRKHAGLRIVHRTVNLSTLRRGAR